MFLKQEWSEMDDASAKNEIFFLTEEDRPSNRIKILNLEIEQSEDD